MFTIDEIKEWDQSQLQWFLSTIPPLQCVSDIEPPIADVMPDVRCEPTFAEDFDNDELLYLLFPTIDAGKKVVLVGEDETFARLIDALGFNEYFVRVQMVRAFTGGKVEYIDEAHTLNNDNFALAVKDQIAIGNIGAVVLLHQEEKLQHLDMIKAVPVYRGNKVSMTKRVPIFHFNSQQWKWGTKTFKDGTSRETLLFTPASLEPIATKPVERHEDDRVGCVERASDIRKEHREWLWPGYLGGNKVAHFGGASTEGKSPVTLDIAARVSAGLDWPDGTPNTAGPKSVILLAAEDDWSDTIVPRLEVAGANLENVYRFTVKQQTVELTPSLDSDCQRLEKQIAQIGSVALVVIDPITNYLGSKQMNHEAEIRGGILMPLATVAKNNHCSIITVGHLNKRGSESTVLQRLMGCAAFSGVARDVFIFGPDPDDEDKYSHTMTEIRNKSASQLKYRTEMVKTEWDGKTSEVIRVKWCGVTHADVDDVVNAPKQQEKSVSGRAVALITGMLRSGAKRKADIDQALKENGINPEQLKFDRIRKRCKAETRALPGKGAGWEWFLATKQEEIFDK